MWPIQHQDFPSPTLNLLLNLLLCHLRMIAEYAATREEMLDENHNNVLEGPLLPPQVIETLRPIFYPMICIQQLTILLFICIDGCR
jgi:hypothetical protein